jgi:hypothetical protein
VLARFRVGDTAHEARWTFDAGRRTVVADDDEARWLSETELPDEPVARRHLAAVRDVVFDFRDDGTLTGADGTETPAPEPEPDPQQETHDLLDELRTRRGVRQNLDLDVDDEEFEGFGPQHAFDFGRDDADVPGAHPVDADPLAEAVVLRPPEPEPEPVLPVVPVDDESPAEPAAERPRTRKGRAKVPSWDEIVFGAKPE